MRGLRIANTYEKEAVKDVVKFCVECGLIATIKINRLSEWLLLLNKKDNFSKCFQNCSHNSFYFKKRSVSN